MKSVQQSVQAMTAFLVQSRPNSVGERVHAEDEMRWKGVRAEKRTDNTLRDGLQLAFFSFTLPIAGSTTFPSSEMARRDEERDCTVESCLVSSREENSAAFCVRVSISALYSSSALQRHPLSLAGLHLLPPRRREESEMIIKQHICTARGELERRLGRGERGGCPRKEELH